MRVHMPRLGALALLCVLAAFASIAQSAQAAGPTLQDESVVGVTSDSVTLNAAINPHGAPTTYYVQYGTSIAYGNTVPAPPGAGIGSEEGNLSVSVHLQNLSAGTVYYYRFVAVGEVGGSPVTVDGAGGTFTTQPTATGFALPDGRAWEMVTPPNKQGAGFRGVGYSEGADIQASENGDAITYAASSPIVANPAGNRALEDVQVISNRLAPGNWETQDITTPHTEGASFVPAGKVSEYKIFSGDLSLGLVEPVGHTALPPLPENAEKTLYLRNPLGEYQALVTSENVPPGTKFGGDGQAVGGVQFASATPTLSHILVSSEVGLTAGTKGGLYEWAQDQFSPVGVLPNKELAEEAILPGYRHPISNDGSRVIFCTFPCNHGPLYLRDMQLGETVQMGEGVFKTANTADSRVFFTSGSNLAVFEVTSNLGKSPLAGKLINLTTGAEEIEGVLGASEDGSRVYFVANGVIGDAAEHGATRENNLYMVSYLETTKTWGSPEFIAHLAGSDRKSWEDNAFSLGGLTSRVSPNGRYLAFMSEKSLTGYENRDVNSGASDEEVFLYDANAGRLVCASCNPTNERPSGIFDTENYGSLFDAFGNWSERWVAANIPGWVNVGIDYARYQSRYLSNEGRLFFNSADALVPADVNGKVDVYEYEPSGVGNCRSNSQSSSEAFAESADGCIALISAGTSSEESAFLDASETGDDVFFLTRSQLLPQDYDTSYDVYDAHACSVSAPCPPPPPLVLPPCTTGDACKSAPTLQPTIFGAPASQTFSGAGNIVPSMPKSTVTTRSSTKPRKLAKALKACEKKPKRKRARCKSQARKKYGARQSRARDLPSARTGR